VKAHVHAQKVLELVVHFQSSLHENMKVNDRDDLASLIEHYQNFLQYPHVQSAYGLKIDIHLNLHDDRNVVMPFPDFYARKMPLPHSISFGI